MVLDYVIARDHRMHGAPDNGHVVLRLDGAGVAGLERIHDGGALAPGQQLLRFRRRGRVRFGAESYFFQEGHAKHYQGARYGELRVSPSGDAVLVGLRDRSLKPLRAS
jgi:uncharacterized membrane-anchored protein